jgi:hypothetical protein
VVWGESKEEQRRAPRRVKIPNVPHAVFMSLKSDIEANSYVLKCRYCGQNCYEYIGVRPINPELPLFAVDLVPIDEQIPELTAGKACTCPFCNSTLITTMG